MQRYFFVGQDRKVQDTIRLEEFDIVNGPRRIFQPEEERALNEAVFLYLKKGAGETVLDFYQSPVTMVSGLVRQVFAMYEEDIAFKRVYLVDREQKRSHNFFIPLIPRLDALSPKVERYPDGREKQVILDGSRTRGRHVFYLESSMSRRPLVSLAAAESLLRRGAVGLVLEEVEVE